MKNKKVLYVRSGPYEVNPKGYNLQEVGLGKALGNLGVDVDILYYSKKKKQSKVLDGNKGTVRILWTKGIKLLRTGIYPQILNKRFLDKYDAVIVSEYSQVMSVLISRIHSNTYVYNGPYYNLFKIPCLEPVYDRLFVKHLKKNVKKFFCKSNLSQNFLKEKGLTNSIVTGVGLDTAKFDKDEKILVDTKNVLNIMSGHRNILYVGGISERKNTGFLMEVFNNLKKDPKNKDVQLVIVGNGSKKYTNYCKKLLNKDVKNDVKWCGSLKNSQLKYIYKMSNLFLLPSLLEIMGMVLLEAMYFGLPVVSSRTAGADMLIDNEKNGYVISEFNSNLWSEKISTILNDDELAIKIGKNNKSKILSDCSWDKIAKVFCENINI